MSLLPRTPSKLPRSVHIFLPNQQMLPLSTEFAPATSPFSDSIYIDSYIRIYVIFFYSLLDPGISSLQSGAVRSKCH